MSIASASLEMTGLFEAELLTELMLRYWEHPLAEDAEFAQALLDRAAEVLRASIAGQQLIDGLRPTDMNLVTALWYAEWSQIEASESKSDPQVTARLRWAETVRRALPSCFCDPDLLP
ncbi:MAG: hypothetical protein ACKV0T_05340 [Planctomycetales bacterium]